MRYTKNEVGRGGYYRNKNNALLLRKTFRGFCSYVITHPKISIVLPLVIAVIPSSKLFSIAISPSQLFKKLTENQYVSKVEVLDDNNYDSAGIPSEGSDFVLLHIWMKCVGENFDNILGKRTLLESLALQNKLLNNISVTIMVKSPFQLWSHSLENLRKDPAPLRTVNSNLLSLPKYSLFGTWKINGLISSAAGITISILVNSYDFPKLLDSLNENMVYLNGISNVTNFHIFPPSNVNGPENESLRLYMMKLGLHYKLFFFLLYFAIFMHLMFSMQKLNKAVKSASGVMLAMVSQLLITVCSAVTSTNFFFKSSNDNIPFGVLSCAVVFFIMNEQIRLLQKTRGSTFESKSVSDSERFSTDTEVDKSFMSCAASSQIESTKSTFLLSIIITFFIPFSRKATFFLLLSLWFGHFLSCTFFTAVLSLDHGRLEENDFISLDDNVLLDEEISVNSNSISHEQQLFDYLKSVCCNRYSIVLTVLYLTIFNINFSIARSSSSLFFKLFRGGISRLFTFAKPATNVIFDQKFIADAAFKLNQDSESQAKSTFLANLTIKNPFLVLKSREPLDLDDVRSQQSSTFDISSFTSSYRLDFYYVFEFLLCVVLLLSCTLLVLQKLMERLDYINSFQLMNGDGLENSMAYAEAKRRKFGGDSSLPHPAEAAAPKVQSANHFHAKELYRGGHSLDIVGIATSKCPFVVSVGLDYKVLVWSPLLDPIPNPMSIPLPRRFWPLSKVVLSNDGYYIAFFSKNNSITTWSRREMKFVWELQLKKEHQTEDPSITAPPLEAFFRKITVSAFRRRKLPPAAALRSGMNSRRSSVSSVGTVGTRFADGGLDAAYEQMVFSRENPDEKDELVFVTPSGYLYSVQTDGELHVEKLTSSKHSLKSCKLLLSPRVNDRLVACDQVGDLYVSTVINNKWKSRNLPVNYDRMLAPAHFSKREKNHLTRPSLNETEILSKTDYTIELVSFVGLILRVIGKEAELIDAMTGCVVRTFTIGLFKPNSLRVFHDNPTHCRFCGSPSVASFSIAYTSFDNEKVALHTFKLESKTKNSICLRVERDPREIRCLGMESAFEMVHYFYDAEDWCVTNNNMLIGIRRVPQNIKAKTGTTSIDTRTSIEGSESSLIKRRTGKGDKESTATGSSDFSIHNIWEGWTMSANGKTSLQKIPVGVNGLIVNRLGPLTRYGAKAVIVGFANIMNMFYVGHEELIFNPEKEDANKEELSLRYVNKRRDRLSHKKLPLNYSSL